MSTPDTPFLPHGGYRKLRSYKVAEAVYDATVVFCRRFYAQDRRMSDQMVQAARSGVRNISEGSGAAATSRKSEMKLTNVARASLSDELLRDYESFLVQNGLRVWPKDSPEALAMRARLAQRPRARPAACACRPGAVEGAGRAVGVCASGPRRSWPPTPCSAPSTRRPICSSASSKARARRFVESGGFTEKLYGARSQARKSDPSDRSDTPGKSPSPACPVCAQPMVQRIARKGPHANQPFWGCSRYPDCQGTRAATPSEQSGQSDQSGKRPKETP